MKEEEKQELEKLRQKQTREIYNKKVKQELGISPNVFDIQTPYAGYNDLGLEYKYKYLKDVLKNQYEYINNEVTLSTSGKIHFIKGENIHIDLSKGLFDLGEKDEYREMTVCMGDGPRTWDRRDIDSVVFGEGRICNSCLQKKRRMAAAKNALMKI